MADITFDNLSTERKGSTGLVAGKGDAHNVKVLLCSTISIGTTASGQTIKFGRIPSNARLLPQSTVYWDDLATSGSPTLDLGLGSVDSNVTSDPDALSNGHDVTAAGSAGVLTASTSHTEYGKPAWDFVASATATTQGELDVYGTIKDATTNATGDVTVILYGYLD